MKKPPVNNTKLSPDQALSSAWQAFSEGNLMEAGKLCGQLVKAFPNHVHAWHLRGLVAMAQDKPKLALDYLAKVKNAPDLLPSVAQTRGRAQLVLGDNVAAAASFQATLDFKPDDAPTHYLLAMALLAQKDKVNARKFFRRAGLLDPTLGAAHYELGVLDLAAGETKSAIAAFSLAAQCLPLAAQVHNNLALAHQANGDVGQAESGLRRALELDAKYAEAWFNLANLLKAKGQTDESNNALATALKLNPSLKETIAE
jgi:tetratricopeptide (TPR) repeat protein